MTTLVIVRPVEEQLKIPFSAMINSTMLLIRSLEVRILLQASHIVVLPRNTLQKNVIRTLIRLIVLIKIIKGRFEPAVAALGL